MRISDWSSDVCSSDLIDRGERIFEAPHYDLRYFSGLCGSRQNVRTEIYAEGSWMELPIGLDSITIIPGTLAQRAFGLQPTLHRVLHRNDDEYIEKDAIIDDHRLRNVTLLIGARDRQSTRLNSTH